EPDLARPGKAARNRSDDRVLDERADLAILERGVFRVADRVAVARSPVPEAPAGGQTPVALARPVTLRAADSRVDQVVRKHPCSDVVPVLLVEGDVLLARQKPLELSRRAHAFLQHSSRPLRWRPLRPAAPSPGRFPAAPRCPETPDRWLSPT